MLKHLFIPSESKSDKNIVLIHGLGGDHRIWKHQIPSLQKKFNVLTIDLPSHAENNKKLSAMTTSIDAVSKEILKVIDYLKLNKCIFIGVSLGTVFIKHIEMYYPKYVESAILVGAIGNVSLFLKASVNIFSKIGDKLPFQFVYRLFSRIIMPLKRSEKSRKIFCKCAEELNATEFKQWMIILAESIKMNLKFKTEERLQNLYISGVFDICFLKGIKKEVAQTRAKLIQLEQCGHVCNIDRREEFNTIVMDYLESKHCTA